MTMDDSMDAAAFAVFIEKFLCPQLWAGAVVVIDNLSAHKLASIVPMIEACGARFICLSPYSPDFNPIELWWSQLKSFFRKFAPTNAFMIERIIAVALNLINPQHLKIGLQAVVIVPHNSGKSCINQSTSCLINRLSARILDKLPTAVLTPKSRFAVMSMSVFDYLSGLAFGTVH